MKEALARMGCICTALATMQSACIIAEHPEMWVLSIIMTVWFAAVTYHLWQLAERLERRKHANRLSVLHDAQQARKSA